MKKSFEPVIGQLIKAPLILIFLFLSAYFAGDIVEKGQALNAVLPYPVLGTLLWLFLLFLLWWLVIQPLLQFKRLTYSKDSSSEISISDLESKLCQNSSDEARELLQQLKDETSGHYTIGTEYSAHQKRLEEIKKKVLSLPSSDAQKIIMTSCQAAAIGVVFSRNNLLDGLILLVIQLRMVVALARSYGYKPSPVFTSLCLGWIISHSFITALMGQSLAEHAGEGLAGGTELIIDLLFGEDEAALMAGDAMTSSFLSTTFSALTEALMAGTSVYITGQLFLHALEHENKELKPETFISWRKEGRKRLCGELLNIVQEKSKPRIGTLVGEGAKMGACSHYPIKQTSGSL